MMVESDTVLSLSEPPIDLGGKRRVHITVLAQDPQSYLIAAATS
jgi:hypothetical protein